MYLRLKDITENRHHNFHRITGNACPLTAPIKGQLKTALCQETELFLLSGLALAAVVSLKNSEKVPGILRQVIVCETTTSGQHTISTSHTCKRICSNMKWIKERSSFHMKISFFGSETLQELLRVPVFLGPWGRSQLRMGWLVRKNSEFQ